MKYLFLSLLAGILLTITPASAQVTVNPNANSRELIKDRAGSPERLKTGQQVKRSSTNAPAYYPKVYQPKKLYGFSFYDGGGAQGMIEFNLNNLSELTELSPWDNDPDYMRGCNLTAGAYAKDTYYFFGANGMYEATNFNTFDFATAKRKVLVNYYEVETQVIKVYGMTFDYSTNTMYAIISRKSSSHTERVLATISLTDGKATDIATLKVKCATFAASYDGHLYGITNDGSLVEINKSDGTLSVIIEDLGYKPSISYNNQSMEFDHTDGSLYWAANTTQEEGLLIKINVASKQVINLGAIGVGEIQITGLYIPFVRNKLDSPSPASELKLTANSNGGNEADLSWKNPTLNLNEDPLSGITKVEVYRNDALVKTFSSAIVGGQMSFHDTNIPNGFNTYKIVAWSPVGDGAPASITGFVGHDIPDAVTNLSLSKVNSTAIRLTWETPQRGIAGGWIDKANITYNITRYPDNVLVKSNHTGNEFTETGFANLKTYYYKVEPVTPDGKGKIAESNHIVMGEVIMLPYQTNFLYPDESNMWTTIDADEDEYYVWEFDPERNAGVFGGDISPAACLDNGKDDWMISSPIRLKGHKGYEVSFDVHKYWKKDTTILEITIGKGTTPQSQSKVVQRLSLTKEEWERKTIRLPNLEEGDYNIGFYGTATKIEIEEDEEELSLNTTIRLTNLEVKGSTASSIKGKITYNSEPAADVEISFKKDDSTITVKSNELGEYSIPYISSGVYTYTVSKMGYSTIEEEVTIGEWSDINLDFVLSILNTRRITGKVLDSRNKPVTNAEIKLTGYKVYQTKSKEDGSFELLDVYEKEGYQLTVFKNKLQQVTQQLNVTEDKNLGNIQMEDKLLSPAEVRATTNATGAIVGWKEPVDKKTYRYDNGIVTGTAGWTAGSFVTVIGNAYRQPAILTGMSWFTVEDGYRDHDIVDVFVFDLDENGNPTLNVLYHEENVENITDKWINYTFNKPVECPNGFVIALSCQEYLSLGTDSGTDPEYPFAEGNTCGSRDYRSEPFAYMESMGMRVNLMLRAEGTPTGAAFNWTPPAATEASRILMDSDKVLAIGNRIEGRPLSIPIVTENEMDKVSEAPEANTYKPVYNVYRFKLADEKNPANWNLLTQEPINTLSYADNSWNTLESGFYKYAIRAVYTGNKVSENTLSEALGKDVITTITLNVSNNVSGASSQNAVVKLRNAENVYTAKTNVSGQAILTDILKGTYEVTVTLPGCDMYTKEADFSVNRTYTMNVQLTEITMAPNALKIETTRVDHQRLFTWNEFGIFDDFEKHNSFEINSPGTTGWSYIDGDGERTAILTTGMDNINFAGMGKPMAYTVFNPYDTEPQTYDYGVTAYSGKQFLACMASKGEANDDYIISPELNITTLFYLSFQGMSYLDDLEQFEIGYSFTGKEAGDFIWCTDVIDVPAEWTEFNFAIPAGAKYVTIHCVSKKKLILMLDDIYIGTNPNRPQALAAVADPGSHSYEVYLDGNKVATQKGNTFLFTNLTEGSHTAGVKAVYTSGMSKMTTINFAVTLSGINDEESNNITLYPNPAKDKLFVEGEYDILQIFSATGFPVATYEQASEINVSSLSEGVYIVRITKGEQIFIKKLVVKK